MLFLKNKTLKFVTDNIDDNTVSLSNTTILHKKKKNEKKSLTWWVPVPAVTDDCNLCSKGAMWAQKKHTEVCIFFVIV